jgi:hypothetical protein
VLRHSCEKPAPKWCTLLHSLPHTHTHTLHTHTHPCRASGLRLSSCMEPRPTPPPPYPLNPPHTCLPLAHGTESAARLQQRPTRFSPRGRGGRGRPAGVRPAKLNLSHFFPRFFSSLPPPPCSSLATPPGLCQFFPVESADREGAQRWHFVRRVLYVVQPPAPLRPPSCTAVAKSRQKEAGRML